MIKSEILKRIEGKSEDEQIKELIEVIDCLWYRVYKLEREVLSERK